MDGDLVMTGARGEGYIEVDGERLPILLTNRALAEVEKNTGKTVLQLAHAVETNDIGINDVAHLLQAGLEYGRRDARAGGKPFQIGDAWRILDAKGFIAVTEVVARAFAEVLVYRAPESAEPNPQ